MENNIKEILKNVLVIKKENGIYKPIKNTSKNDVYKAIYELRQLLNMTNYEISCLNEKEKKMESKKSCKICGESLDDVLYEYENQLLCWDCLKWELEKKGEIIINTREIYQNGELEYIGTNDDIDEVIKSICEYCDVKEVKNE